MERYNNVAFKASHNSYDRDESITQQLTFNYDDPSNAGCSGIELDIVQKDDDWKWSVSHGGSYNSKADKQLSAYLQQIVDWRTSESGYDYDRVINIYLDIKNKHMSENEFPDQIDDYIKNIIDEDTIFKPNELIGDKDDLVSGAQTTGWPDLDSLKSKYIICFSGDEDRKRRYAGNNPKKRLCFSDKYLETNPPEYPDFEKGTRVFMNYHLYQKYYDKWHEQIRNMVDQPGFITRGYVLNSQEIWIKAQNAGVNIMATDKVCNHSWARNGDYPFKTIS